MSAQIPVGRRLRFMAAGALFSGLLCCVGCTTATTEAKNTKQDKDEKLKSLLMNMAKKEAQPKAAYVPAPELENVNIYARALEVKLRRKYNNLPTFSGEVGRVQLLPMGEPKTSLDGKKMRMRWSQVVFDNWGERISELEKEYFEVTFADGKPLAYRTRPTITVGLDNESGYSEFAPVRGRNLSGKKTSGNPQMYDRPDSEKNGLLDDHLRSKDAKRMSLSEFDEKGFSANYSVKRKKIPVVQPAQNNLQALLAGE